MSQIIEQAPGLEATEPGSYRMFSIVDPETAAFWYVAARRAGHEQRTVAGEELDQIITSTAGLEKPVYDEELGCSYEPLSPEQAKALKVGKEVLVCTTLHGVTNKETYALAIEQINAEDFNLREVAFITGLPDPTERLEVPVIAERPPKGIVRRHSPFTTPYQSLRMSLVAQRPMTPTVDPLAACITRPNAS